MDARAVQSPPLTCAMIWNQYMWWNGGGRCQVGSPAPLQPWKMILRVPIWNMIFFSLFLFMSGVREDGRRLKEERNSLRQTQLAPLSAALFRATVMMMTPCTTVRDDRSPTLKLLNLSNVKLATIRQKVTWNNIHSALIKTKWQRWNEMF